MCIAYPMKIDSIAGNTAGVSSGDVKSTVNIQLIKGAKPGDFVLVHAGIAIEKIDKVRAREILEALKELEKHCE